MRAGYDCSTRVMSTECFISAGGYLSSMTLADWVRDTETRISSGGTFGARESAYELYLGMWRRLSKLYTYEPIHIYDEKWDVLVILDACRYDLMQEVATDYDWLSGLRTVDSAAACTPEWMKANFIPEFNEEMAKTVHVTANMWSEEHLSEKDFRILDEVWKSAWDDEVKTVRPEVVTDAAIHHYREKDPERMIVHYIQPHYPFISNPLSYGDRRGEGEWVKVWDRLRRGEVLYEEVWDAYRENLRAGLNSVETLLKNINAESVVISSDHGNLIGEYGIYGHPDNVSLPPSRHVPWAETSAKNVENREVNIDDGDMSVDRMKQLEYLGYK